MTRRVGQRRRSRDLAGAFAIASALWACGLGCARAEDGFGGFLQNLFGGGAQPAPASRGEIPGLSGGAEPRRRPSGARFSRPLTVKLHRPKAAVASRGPAEKPGPVTLLTDRTLRRGDAVMTAKGMRIFVGAAKVPPYTDSDFVAVSEAARLDKDLRKTLVSIDNASRR